MLFYLVICLLSQTRYIFAHAQMRYNLPCGRLRYDINPFTPEGAYRIEDISHAARVYRKSRKGFISLRSVLKGTTLMRRNNADYVKTEISQAIDEAGHSWRKDRRELNVLCY